jgi:hypothetical protein
MNNQKIATIVNGMLATAKNAQSKALKVTEVKKLNAEIQTAERQKYEVSLDLARELYKVKPVFDEFFKALNNRLKDDGLTAKELPKKDEVIFLVYGLSKSWFHRLVKVGGVCVETPEIRNKFNALCDEAEANGEPFTRSIDALNTWASKYDEHKGEADTDGETLSELRSNGDKKVILWQIKEGNKSLTMYSDHTHKTNFTLIEINAFFNEVLKPSILSTFAIRKATTKKDTDILTEIQKKRVQKLPVSKELI